MIEFVKIYDLPFNLANFTVGEDFEHYITVPVEDDFLIDFDRRNRPVAIEMFNTSKKFTMLRPAFSLAKIEGIIIITDEIIRIEMKIPEMSKFLEREVPNVYGILPGEFPFTIGENVV